MRSGDADTNACFAGALVGALLGYKALPAPWIGGLNHVAGLPEKAKNIATILRAGYEQLKADKQYVGIVQFLAKIKTSAMSGTSPHKVANTHKCSFYHINPS